MKTMKERLKLRMRKDRPMTVISLRIPEDVVDELKEIAPLLGVSGYQPLIRNYIGQGLRRDLSRLMNTPAEAIAESLRKQGVDEDVITAALAEAGLRTVSPVAAGVE
jgi:predicted transcriptional regulator